MNICVDLLWFYMPVLILPEQVVISIYKQQANAYNKKTQMGKKCLIVNHSSHKYILQLQDLKKIIFRPKKSAPMLPRFHSALATHEPVKIE